MTKQADGYWTADVTAPNASSLSFALFDQNGNWDNNGGFNNNYNFAVIPR